MTILTYLMKFLGMFLMGFGGLIVLRQGHPMAMAIVCLGAWMFSTGLKQQIIKALRTTTQR